MGGGVRLGGVTGHDGRCCAALPAAVAAAVSFVLLLRLIVAAAFVVFVALSCPAKRVAQKQSNSMLEREREGGSRATAGVPVQRGVKKYKLS